jgi:hypothetical protein
LKISFFGDESMDEVIFFGDEIIFFGMKESFLGIRRSGDIKTFRGQKNLFSILFHLSHMVFHLP